jgi:hypothetical protein
VTTGPASGPRRPQTDPGVLPLFGRLGGPAADLGQDLIGQLGRLGRHQDLHLGPPPHQEEMDPEAVAVEQAVVLATVLLVVPVDLGVRRHERIDGVEVWIGGLAGEPVLAGDEGQKGQIDQALSQSPVRQRPDGLDQGEGLKWSSHVSRLGDRTAPAATGGSVTPTARPSRFDNGPELDPGTGCRLL